jgi:pyruvate/2-oxoglutarate dehydrogenase complex dihydrolipoamide dehydrogenase (E3) component
MVVDAAHNQLTVCTDSGVTHTYTPSKLRGVEVYREETAGLMKLVVDATTDRILGAAVLGVEGGELVQILSTLMLTDLPYTVLKGVIYIHPTLAEGFFGLMDAVKPVDTLSAAPAL